MYIDYYYVFVLCCVLSSMEERLCRAALAESAASDVISSNGQYPQLRLLTSRNNMASIGVSGKRGLADSAGNTEFQILIISCVGCLLLHVMFLTKWMEVKGVMAPLIHSILAQNGFSTTVGSLNTWYTTP